MSDEREQQDAIAELRALERVFLRPQRVDLEQLAGQLGYRGEEPGVRIRGARDARQDRKAGCEGQEGGDPLAGAPAHAEGLSASAVGSPRARQPSRTMRAANRSASIMLWADATPAPAMS